jgi:hypothetical protein
LQAANRVALVAKELWRIRKIDPAAWLAVFLSLFSIGHASAVPADCPLEKSRYVIRDERDMTAGFASRQDSPADVFLFVHSASRNETAWFRPYRAGSPDFATHLASTTDITAPDWRMDGPKPLGDLDYAAIDENGRPMPDFWLHRGIRAPAHILIARLQDVLLYGAPSDSHEGLSLAFLDFDGCNPG